jgi:predicted dehydrogenase
MTRVAVIGVGMMGRNHARVYSEIPDIELAAVVDANSELAEKAGGMFHVPAYSDLQIMLDAERPEAVSVVVPTYLHFSVARQALENGCHVLVEKPIATSIEDAKALIAIAEEQDRILTVGHIERYNPAIIELKKRLDAGELGKIFQIHARRLGPSPTRIQDVGVALDLAPHDLDIMRFLIGSEAQYVFAHTKREMHVSQEDLFVGMVGFEDQTIGLLEINWLTPTKIRELYVTGAYGMFKVNYITQDLFFYQNAEVNGNGWPVMNLLRGVGEGTTTQFVIQKKEPLRVELESFVNQVRGKQVSLVNGKDALAALEMVSGFMESASNHQVKMLR